MENHSIFLNLKTDTQFNSLSNAVVESIAGVQIRKALAAQSNPIATDNLPQSTGTDSEIHQAAAITTGTVDADDNQPKFDTACSSVLTNSMRNCRKVGQTVCVIAKRLRIMWSQLCKRSLVSSTHKCTKTYYAETRDGIIHSFEVDTLIDHVKQDLIGGRAIANGLNSK